MSKTLMQLRTPSGEQTSNYNNRADDFCHETLQTLWKSTTPRQPSLLSRKSTAPPPSLPGLHDEQVHHAMELTSVRYKVSVPGTLPHWLLLTATTQFKPLVTPQMAVIIQKRTQLLLTHLSVPLSTQTLPSLLQAGEISFRALVPLEPVLRTCRLCGSCTFIVLLLVSSFSDNVGDNNNTAPQSNTRSFPLQFTVRNHHHLPHFICTLEHFATASAVMSSGIKSFSFTLRDFN
jgi:hypothetical protein